MYQNQNEPNKTRQILRDPVANVSASIYMKWSEKYGLDIMEASSLMSFEGLSMAELIHIQKSLCAAISKESSKFE
ncbi:MAG TPA: hypothetical protein V6D12_13750 [Candidatus Obscuribacterales bacterium]